MKFKHLFIASLVFANVAVASQYTLPRVAAAPQSHASARRSPRAFSFGELKRGFDDLKAEVLDEVESAVQSGLEQAADHLSQTDYLQEIQEEIEKEFGHLNPGVEVESINFRKVLAKRGEGIEVVAIFDVNDKIPYVAHCSIDTQNRTLSVQNVKLEKAAGLFSNVERQIKKYQKQGYGELTTLLFN